MVFDSANLERIPDAEVLLMDATTNATVAGPALTRMDVTRSPVLPQVSIT